MINIKGANDETARNILEACNWNLELAINMHVDANEGADFIEEIPPQIPPQMPPQIPPLNPSNSMATEQNEAVASERCQVR